MTSLRRGIHPSIADVHPEETSSGRFVHLQRQHHLKRRRNQDRFHTSLSLHRLIWDTLGVYVEVRAADSHVVYCTKWNLIILCIYEVSLSLFGNEIPFLEGCEPCIFRVNFKIVRARVHLHQRTSRLSTFRPQDMVHLACSIHSIQNRYILHKIKWVKHWMRAFWFRFSCFNHVSPWKKVLALSFSRFEMRSIIF
jgi:hypothetical protein